MGSTICLGPLAPLVFGAPATQKLPTLCQSPAYSFLGSLTPKFEVEFGGLFNAPEITVDNLEVAQFLYLLLDNKNIRRIINTITSKVVLILGRFTPERKAVLDAIRDELRKRDYLPVLFDFEKPSSRDITETVSTLAHMARLHRPPEHTFHRRARNSRGGGDAGAGVCSTPAHSAAPSELWWNDPRGGRVLPSSPPNPGS
jgi:hypothetical protein